MLMWNCVELKRNAEKLVSAIARECKNRLVGVKLHWNTALYSSNIFQKWGKTHFSEQHQEASDLNVRVVTCFWNSNQIFLLSLSKTWIIPLFRLFTKAKLSNYWKLDFFNVFISSMLSRCKRILSAPWKRKCRVCLERTPRRRSWLPTWERSTRGLRRSTRSHLETFPTLLRCR